MARFLVQFRRVETFDAEVEADDRRAALKASYEVLHNEATTSDVDWSTEAVTLLTKTEDGDDVEEDEWLVRGVCDGCSLDLFDDEGHHGDDVTLCDTCYAQEKVHLSAERVEKARGEGRMITAEEAWAELCRECAEKE